MPAPDAISCDKLARLIGTPRAPVILDVRRAALRTDDPRAIPAARLLNEADLRQPGVSGLLPDLRGQSVVVVCVAGHGRSQGLAALLRAEGIAAEYLEGGARGLGGGRSADRRHGQAGRPRCGGTQPLGHAVAAQGRPDRLPLADPAVYRPTRRVPVCGTGRGGRRSRTLWRHAL